MKRITITHDTAATSASNRGRHATSAPRRHLTTVAGVLTAVALVVAGYTGIGQPASSDEAGKQVRVTRSGDTADLTGGRGSSWALRVPGDSVGVSARGPSWA